jgi:enoyl-CoA hydratase
VLAHQRGWTDDVFSEASIPAILKRLRLNGSAEASALADVVSQKSPLALAVTLEALRRARELPSLEAALHQEYRVSRHSSTTHDFAEGIRAQLVDKDRNPSWSPPSHAGVTNSEVEAFFTTPPDGDLDLTIASASKETA